MKSWHVLIVLLMPFTIAIIMLTVTGHRVEKINGELKEQLATQRLITANDQVALAISLNLRDEKGGFPPTVYQRDVAPFLAEKFAKDRPIYDGVMTGVRGVTYLVYEAEDTLANNVARLSAVNSDGIIVSTVSLYPGYRN